MNTNTTTVAVIGAGTIGLSWIALFAANGLTVRVTDPRPDLADAVREALSAATPSLAAQGLATDGLLDRITFATDIADAARGADFIQENGPEKAETKRQFAIDALAAAPEHALFLSSTSRIPASVFAEGLEQADRILVTHPLNPPYAIPLVEVVPGERTSAGAVKATVEFYRSLGRIPVVEHKEVAGFVTTEIQKAVMLKASELVLDGVVNPAELDLIVRNSLGLRWAAIGPFLAMHLGGGPGGYRAFGRLYGQGEYRPDRDEKVVDLVEESYGLDSYEEYGAVRDRRQLAALEAFRKDPLPTER